MARLTLTTRRVSPGLMLLVAIPAVAAVGMVDWATGPVAMSLLYYVPVFAAAWLAGLWPGLITAAASGSALLVAALTVAEHPAPVIYWNSATRLVTFLAISLFVSLIRRDRDKLGALNAKLNLALENETNLARTDAVTGLPNGRAFRETLAREVARSQREGRALGIGYLDLDNFKTINDGHGHDEGDRVLRRVADALRETIRGEDIAARIGGDEFGIALMRPDEEGCEVVGARILEKVRAIGASYPTTGFGATIGFVAFRTPPLDVDAMLKIADDLMYEVKAKEKGTFVVVRR